MAKNPPKKTKKNLYLCIAAAAVLLLGLALFLLLRGGEEPPVEDDGGSETPPVEDGGASETPPAYTDSMSLNIGSGLTVVDIGSYTGMYMEDGSNEIVSGVVMCIVRNDGDRAVEYAQLKLNDGQKDIPFTLTALLPGRSAVLLATDRAAHDKAATYTAAMAESVAFFSYEPSLQADRLKIQGLDGGLNITNISQEDIAGDVVIYYKNAASDGLLYGGITYRTRISGGIKAGELKQGMTQHFRLGGSEVLFVTVAE